MKALAAGSSTSLPNSRGMKEGMASASALPSVVAEVEVEVEVEEVDEDEACRGRSTIGLRRRRSMVRSRRCSKKLGARNRAACLSQGQARRGAHG